MATYILLTHSAAAKTEFLTTTFMGSLQSVNWTGLDWTGLDWTGLGWTGLDWLISSHKRLPTLHNNCALQVPNIEYFHHKVCISLMMQFTYTL